MALHFNFYGLMISRDTFLNIIFNREISEINIIYTAISENLHPFSSTRRCSICFEWVKIVLERRAFLFF